MSLLVLSLFFFFSSRRRHTRSLCDWSSDVCSSDLILVRYYTTPTVQETRGSVFWTLFFIMAMYITIPALAVLVKYDIYTSLVGSSFSHLPDWVSYWGSIDKLHPLVSITDVNRDGIVQLAEISMDVDIVVLATPEIAG